MCVSVARVRSLAFVRARVCVCVCVCVFVRGARARAWWWWVVALASSLSCATRFQGCEADMPQPPSTELAERAALFGLRLVSNDTNQAVNGLSAVSVLQTLVPPEGVS